MPQKNKSAEHITEEILSVVYEYAGGSETIQQC